MKKRRAETHGEVGETAATATDEVEVVLKKPHRHRGKDHQAGETLVLRADQAQRLREHDVI